MHTFLLLVVAVMGLCLSTLPTPAKANDAFSIPNTSSITLEDSDRSYKVFIKLPNSYQENDPAQYYPVVYMTDAMYNFQVVSGVTRLPMNMRNMQQAILVGVDWQEGMSPAASRIRDYTPSSDESWKRKTGEAERHLHFIANKLMPHINKTYRTIPSQNTLVGHSLGGLFGAYSLLTQPELFSHYLLSSPSLWFNDKQLMKQFRSSDFMLKSINAKVFIAIGEYETAELTDFGHDMVNDAKEFKAILEQKNRLSATQGINIKLQVIAEADHSMAFPTAAIQGLSWFLPQQNSLALH
ncbi:alpha/beta hydrolase [Shewanella sp. TC10]|uniref:alpha/beta hydrolase n=1 Tax=Shewanella sp. TC10 TaxID=1419739 RepID=UPI00129DB272|nr:alpha/beta hydrolase-fold protein [Shewanella sp. TC10]